MADPTIRMPTCLSCGTTASPGESYCRNCGKLLFTPAATAPPPRQSPPPQSTVTAVSPATPAGVPFPQAPLNVGRKRRSPVLLGCLVFLGLVIAVIAGAGIYVWRSTIYTPPERTAPQLPERASGTMTEFPVDNDPNAPARPTSVQTEALGGTMATSTSTLTTKLPPGIDRTRLAKGATSMTSSTYKPKDTNSATSTGGEVYIYVLNTMPNQPNFASGLVSSILEATGGEQTGVRVEGSTGVVYAGSKIRSADANVYVLTKEGGDIVVILYSDDPANQSIGRLAQNVGNGQGLIDYPELKGSLWTLPASTPTGMTLVEISTISGTQIEEYLGRSFGNGEEDQRVLSHMRAFLPARLTGARYREGNNGEWMSFNFEYESSFQAWRTFLLVRGALGIGGTQSTTVRDVKGLYFAQEAGIRVFVFQKGPYLIILTGPDGTTMERMVALGNQFQV